MILKKLPPKDGSKFPIGNPSEGDYSKGINEFSPSTHLSDAIKNMDEILAELAPSDAGSLDGQPLEIYNNTTTKYTGYLSHSDTATYKPGEEAGSQVDYIIKDADFVLETPDPTFRINKGDQGTLKIYINDELKDTFDLAGNFNEDERDGNQSYPPKDSPNGYITVVSVGKYNNFKKWQKCVARINISPSDLREGWNKITLVHDLDVDQVSQDFDVFYDVDTGPDPSVSVPTLSIHSLVSSKYLSGVRFLSLNDVVKFSVTGYYLFNNVYLPSPIRYSGLKGVADGEINIFDSSVSGVSNPPKVGETMTVTDKQLMLDQPNQSTKDGKIACTPKDPYGSYTSKTSASQNLLISTYPDGAEGVSDNVREYFSDEYYRLPLSHDFDSKTNDITGQWDSSAALTNGNAQCYLNSSNVHALVYPSINFTSGYSPSQTVDYSGFSGDQKYARCFIAPSNKTSVTLEIGGISGGIGQLGTGDINIEIKLPTQTAWLDAAKPYDSAEGADDDGDGCLNGSIEYSGGKAILHLTFGGKTTGDSNQRMYIRVTLRNANREITSIICSDWT